MKLIDLLEAIRGKEWSWDTTERIQICEPGIGWDDFSEFHAGSQLLKPFTDLEVAFIGSVAEDVIRVSLYDENFRGVKGYFPMRCMVGDMVYEILEETVPNHYFYISEHKVQDVSVKAIKYADEWEQYDYENLYFTREGAEAALEKRRREK